MVQADDLLDKLLVQATSGIRTRTRTAVKRLSGRALAQEDDGDTSTSLHSFLISCSNNEVSFEDCLAAASAKSNNLDTSHLAQVSPEDAFVHESVKFFLLIVQFVIGWTTFGLFLTLVALFSFVGTPSMENAATIPRLSLIHI